MFQKEDIKYPKSPEEDSVNIFNQATFWWLNSFISKGYNSSSIEDKDIYERASSEKAHVQNKKWRKSEKVALAARYFGTGYPLWTILTYLYGWKLAFAGIFFLIQLICTFAAPLFLDLFINFLKDPHQENISYGLFYASMLFITPALKSISYHQYYVRVQKIALNVRFIIFNSRLKLLYKQQFLENC